MQSNTCLDQETYSASLTVVANANQNLEKRQPILESLAIAPKTAFQNLSNV